MSGSAVVRGIEHVGVTVPDIEEATVFLGEAFGARVVFDLLAPKTDYVATPSERLPRRIGALPGTVARRVRMLRLADGPNIELFEFEAEEQRSPARPNDFGIQHFSVLVDDIAAAAERVQLAGGTLFDGPNELPGLEAGEGCLFWYTRTPWGSLIELLAVPGAQAYHAGTDDRRWLPGQEA